MKSWLVGLTMIVLGVTPLSADLTLVQTVSGRGLGDGVQTTTYFKGTKMRSETKDTISILDVASHQMIVLDAKKKEARIIDMAQIQEGVQKALGGETRAKLTSTGQTKMLMGRSCAEYTANIAVPMKMGEDTLNVLMTGPIWIAKGAPGTADYTGFYRAAAENGMFFGNPDQAKGPGAAQMRSMVELYRQIAELGGVTYETALQTKFEGSGMMAAMMNKVGGFTFMSTVKSTATDPISDAMFEVPAGYKTKTK